MKTDDGRGDNAKSPSLFWPISFWPPRPPLYFAGGMIALEFASNYPSKVLSLTLGVTTRIGGILASPARRHSCDLLLRCLLFNCSCPGDDSLPVLFPPSPRLNIPTPLLTFCLSSSRASA